MFKTLKIVFALIVMTLAVAADAEELTGEYWSCKGMDSSASTYTANAKFERQAITRALENCKKDSKYPISCKATPDMCQVFNPTTTWRCAAFDNNGGNWHGEYVSSREGAISSAARSCHALSFTPSTCTVHVIACTVKERTS